MPPGFGSTTFQFRSRKKQADAGVRPIPSRLPSTVLEVGDSESLTQLKVDARLWLEHMPEVQLVILLSVDPLVAPHPNLLRITIQLWRGFSPHHPRQGEARMVRDVAWTHAVTPLYILFSDIFKGQVPAARGINDRVHLDTVAWRQAIIEIVI